MAALLLVLFPVLLMFNSRLALVALGLAIVMLYRGRVSEARRTARQRSADDSI
jgi:hypothetical protein